MIIDLTIPHDEKLVKAEKDKSSKYLDSICGMYIQQSLGR